MRKRAQAALALVAVAAALAPMLAIGFVNDDFTIIEFALHRPMPLLQALLSRAEVIEVYYRPLFDLTLALDFLVWGWTPFGFRLTNLALHLVNTLLVYRLATGLRFDRLAALCALLVFGLHPIHETSLYWIAGRTDVLCASFYLGSLLFVVRHRESRGLASIAAAIGFCVLAMLTKEMALTIPLVVFAITWWLERDQAIGRRARAGLRMSWPFALAIVGVLIVRYVALDNNLFGAQGIHGSVPAFQIVRNVATYVGLMVIPLGHDAIDEALRAQPMLFAGLAVTSLAVAVLAILRWRQSLGPLLFSLTAILLTMIPVLRLMMRWYLYIPSIFFAIGTGWVISRIGGRSRQAALATLGALSILYAAIDLTTINDWVRASRIAEAIGADLRRTIGTTGERDTLRFVTIPGKIDQTPVFNLGFAGTVRHLLGRERVVEVSSKLAMPEYPTRIASGLAGGGDSIVIDAPEGGHFALSNVAVVAQQVVPAGGSTVETEAGVVRIARMSAARRPTSIALFLEAPRPTLRLFTFDGERFVELAHHGIRLP